MNFCLRAGRFLAVVFPAFLTLLLSGGALQAQQRAAEITEDQSLSLPYRLSGRLNVTFGDNAYFGTATSVRRFTGATAGHMLYDPKAGFGTDLYFESALYQVDYRPSAPVSYFAVLGGYQAAANVDPNSNAAFDYDMGYVLFVSPAFQNEWAAFGANTDALTAEASFLVLGYAAETFPGDEQAFVDIAQPFYELQSPALYENTNYYTQEGMSGGPLYVTKGNAMQVAAVTVAGTSPPHGALSDVRAFTPAEITLFTEAEYAHGLIVSGVIHGPTSLAPGASGKFKTGVVFKDGVTEGRDIPRNYDELTLRVQGHHKKKVTVTKLKTSKFEVRFDGSLPGGTAVTLELVRTTGPASQTPLQTLTVNVQAP